MGRYLGIDFGIARLGLAISDERRCLALPIGKIRAGKTFAETLISLREALLPYPNIERVVIGLPLQLNGTEGEMARLVRAFAGELEQTFQLPVVFWDERLTSSEVEQRLKEAGLNRKKRAQHSDEMAAMTILQNYLDLKRGSL